MLDTAAATYSAIRLRPFVTTYAADVAGWVRSEDELRWLAPSTRGPLTPTKVREWVKPNGLAFVATLDDPRPAAYGELNPMRREPWHLWIGHVIVRPDHRGCGLGRRFVQALVNHAFDVMAATRLSLVVFPDNDGAIACYQRVGFAIATEESHRFVHGGPMQRLLRLELHRST